MHYRILGPLEVLDDERRPVAFGGRLERVLLAVLLLEANRVVSCDRLVDAVWGDHPPETATNTLQVHISKLRRTLGASSGTGNPIHTQAPGYVLRTSRGELDSERFEELATESTLDDGPATVSDRLAEALALWRGSVLDGIEVDGTGRTDVVRLDELRASVLGRRIEADLALGRHAELVGELEALARAYPLREQLHGQLMLALYRSGRQADALGVYRRTRELLAEEIGVDPSPELQELELAILNQAPELGPPFERGRTAAGTGGPPGTSAAPLRQAPSAPSPSGAVTLLFSDIEGSTRAWEHHPTEMGVALARHEVLVRGAIESAGGYVFKTVGDAFCAAFTTPTSALVAAADAQLALSAEPWPEVTPIRVRMALHSGVCEEREDDYFGPVVNRVARLGAAAHGGQTLLSNSTVELLGGVLPAGTTLTDLGEHRLKDLERPMHAFQLNVDGLSTDFPALRSLNSPRLYNNLPVQPSSFVGRRRELAQLHILLGETRLVTLTGSGGAGKTRLALQVAANLLDGSGDGVWLVDLAPLDSDDLVALAVASVLGVSPDPNRPMASALGDALAERSFLLLLDNCEHLIHAVARLTQELLETCPGLSVLATSREPLGLPGEHVFRIPSLTTPNDDDDADAVRNCEAVQLFVERAIQRGVSLRWDAGTASAVAHICRRLDGIPFALELGAACLRLMSLPELEGRLDQRFALLTGGSRTALPRQQTLLAMVTWSWDLLSANERDMLARLSVFAGGFDFAAVGEVIGVGAMQAGDFMEPLAALVDKSLVQLDEGGGGQTRYRLLETVRDFASGQLEELDDNSLDVVRIAHRDHYLALAEAAAPHLVAHDQAAWLDRLDSEFDNLCAAIAFSLKKSDLGPALRLATSLRMFWRARGHALEGIEFLRDVLSASSADGPTLFRAQALAAAAFLLRQIGGYETAEAYVAEALEIAVPSGEHSLIADLLDTRGLVLLRRGRPTEVLTDISSGLDLARQVEEPHLIARLLVS
jgi:predicted ATPase/class 3 adenylate cyclase/DNA-binding SARP family transcriptional activator